jgi:ABC-type glycerol-3-phosphate transport system substrate-binding protein
VKKYIALLLCLVFALNLFGCSVEKSKSENLTYYYSKDSHGTLIDVIESYNKYCNNNLDNSYKIELKEFESENELYTKISTEIMAGSGPDIISLNQKLPFEKLIENNSLLDVNTLIDDEIDINKYNSVVMNVGVYDGKRYIIPLFYGIDVLVSTKERLKKYGVDCDNGTALTYEGMSKTFKKYFNNPRDCSFVPNLNFIWFNSPLQLFDRFINNYVDFENKVTYFDSDEFNNNLDAMYKMVKLSKENTVKSLFDDLYINRSFPLITGNYAYYKSIDENPVVCRGLIENDKVYSSFVQIGFAVNNNTKYKKQIYEFIKYALSDEVQMKMCGAIGNSYSASTAFPVNKKAFEQSKYVASTRTDDDEKIIGIENDFVSSYIDVAEKINKCTLYMNVSNSYYNSSIIGDIVDSYLNDDISKEKFIRQLTAATEIYLTE